MKSQEIQHLVEVLLRHLARVKTWGKLAAEIRRVSDFDDGLSLDHRSLKRLCEEPDKVYLKLGHLLAIDRWLRVNDEAPLLARHRSLLDSVRESFNINFVVASTTSPHSRYEVISRFDFRAINRLMRTSLNRLNVSIRDVGSPDLWDGDDVRITNASNISIASPVTSYPSQAMMSKMIGIDPDAAIDFEKLPFYIVGCDRDEALERSFVRRRSEIEKTDYANRLPSDTSLRALVCNNEWYLGTDDTDYALILAQRNPGNGHVQVVLSGLTGVGTYKLSKIVQSGQPAETMPPLKSGERRPPILAAIYRVSVGTDRENGDSHGQGALEWNAVGAPAWIRHAGGKWEFSR